MSAGPKPYDDPDRLADDLIAEVGKEIVLALPLGLGKANRVANALFARAVADRSISLRIFTALTLEKPKPASELERRFIEPVVDRLFGDYPELAYCAAIRDGSLPDNIEVNEFFFVAGRWLGTPLAQQSYIAANYTHAAGYLLSQGVNLIAQLVATPPDGDRQRYSLSCNPDITLDLLEARNAGKARFKLVGEVNSKLPFMPGDADLSAGSFSHMLTGPKIGFPLFAPPKEPVKLSDHAIGLHVANLIPDGGTLQIGIGSIGDAVTHGLILRHQKNKRFKDAVKALSGGDVATHSWGGDAPFERGLYGASEMFVDGFLDLAKAGVLKREVEGAVLHAGFFVGPNSFYQALRDMTPAERARFRMTAISYVNQLYGEEEAKRRARKNARFVNNAMMATLVGGIVSDGLEDGRVVSGVGGQYNFVAQAFALDDARSIITVNATREDKSKTVSNILWSYGHETIPRHLRDVVVTEYGVADLRGKTDGDVIAAMLKVADSRFQEKLLAEAKQAGKIAKDYEIPEAYRNNTPTRVERALAPLQSTGDLPTFPLGTDFTATEQRLIPALQCLQSVADTPWRLLPLLWRGRTADTVPDDERNCLERMALAEPESVKERLYAALLRAALAETRSQTSAAEPFPASPVST